MQVLQHTGLHLCGACFSWELRCQQADQYHALPVVPAGVGATRQIPVSSCDSRNVLETEDDPYWSESVLVRVAGAATALASTTLLPQLIAVC
jgi:hypothetical protein